MTRLPLDGHAISWLEQFLSDNDVLATNGTNDKMPYRVRDYFHPEISVHAYIDRNIFSHAISLQRIANSGTVGQEQRIAAACACFLNLIDAQVEPNIAIYELSSRSDRAHVNEEYRRYRVAINVHPVSYYRIAIGAADCIPEHDITEIEDRLSNEDLPDVMFERGLRHWKSIYLCLLKVACLLKGKNSSFSTAKAYINWMVHEFVMNGVELPYVLVGLSSRSPGILRGFRSDNPDTLSDALRRASWDLMYLRFLQKKSEVTDSTKINLLCTRDAPLRNYAQKVVFGRDGVGIDEVLRPFWGDHSTELAALVHDNERVTQEAGREAVIEARLRAAGEQIRVCENELGLNEL
ncbi:hypothetical protein KJ682_02755 [bacterium]|nr:hypothetical protein [bacterium]